MKREQLRDAELLNCDMQPLHRRRGGDAEDCAAMASDAADARLISVVASLCSMEQMVDFQVRPPR
jgi:hypothetical protein